MELALKSQPEPTVRDVAKLKDDFHMEEYRSLRQEILLLKGQQFTIQKWVVVSIGIIYALALNVGTEGLQKALPTIHKPLLLISALVVSAIGSLFYGVNDALMQSTSRYIKEIEERFAKGNKPKGWETFLAPARVHHTWGVRNPFWVGVLGITGAIALLPWVFPKVFEFFLKG